LIGIKVWICKGEVYGKRDLSPNFGMAKGGARKGGPGNKQRKRN
jgi:small subunit ribosomal protein S3